MSSEATAERQRIRLALLGCLRCEKIHELRQAEPCEHHPDTRHYAPSWADPVDGHAYEPRWRSLCTTADLAAVIDDAPF